MLVLDANLWVSAFDPTDRFHGDSLATFRAAAEHGHQLAGPAFVVLESACALGRRLADADKARATGSMMADHPDLHLEPLTQDLLAEAERLGLDLRLRGADALYLATARRLGCELLSWDAELIDRGGAISPRDWLATV